MAKKPSAPALDLAALHGDFHARRHWNWFISDT
jgi:hypothetical protein